MPDAKSTGSPACGPPPPPGPPTAPAPPAPPQQPLPHFPGSGPDGGGAGPCQSKCTNPYECPACAGSASAMNFVPSFETVAVPYGTMNPRVGSSVINVTDVPGLLFRMLGKFTATGWLATALAG